MATTEEMMRALRGLACWIEETREWKRLRRPTDESHNAKALRAIMAEARRVLDQDPSLSKNAAPAQPAPDLGLCDAHWTADGRMIAPPHPKRAGCSRWSAQPAPEPHPSRGAGGAK